MIKIFPSGNAINPEDIRTLIVNGGVEPVGQKVVKPYWDVETLIDGLFVKLARFETEEEARMYVELQVEGLNITKSNPKMKVFRDGLAVNTEQIFSISVEKDTSNSAFEYVVTAYGRGNFEVLEYFYTQEEAERYVDKIVYEMNNGK